MINVDLKIEITKRGLLEEGSLNYLFDLYLPLIGKDSAFLYMFLMNSIKTNRIFSTTNELINKCFLGSCKFKSYNYDYNSKNQEDLLQFYEKHILEYQKMLTDNLQNIKSNQILIRHGLILDIKGYSNNEVFKYADLMWKMYTNNVNDYVYKSDGIIFHPKNANYYNYDIQEQKTDLLKWKPTNRNTIDFYIEFEKNPLRCVRKDNYTSPCI